MKVHKQAGLGSPGIDELRWLKPVYPGDTLRCKSEVLSKRRSASRPEMGLFESKLTVFNQQDQPVMTMRSTGLIRVRDPTQLAALLPFRYCRNQANQRRCTRPAFYRQPGQEPARRTPTHRDHGDRKSTRLNSSP